MDIHAGGIRQPMQATRQRTLKTAIACTGTGLHSGLSANLVLRPAPADTGIVFHRTDLGGTAIPARYDMVTNTRLCTVLSAPSDPSATVGTVEHLMAALAATGIVNLHVDVDGPEVPVLDGSAEPFLFLFDCAGIRDQAALTAPVQVMQAVRAERGDAFIEVRPNPVDALDISLSIVFPDAAIGRQSFSLRLTEATFRAELARARTFTAQRDIDALRAAGLARGGSLDNAVVVDGDAVLNPAGLRMANEFVRHKMLDIVGDLALGGILRGRVTAFCTGHGLNNQLLRNLYAIPNAWRGLVGALDAAPVSLAA